MEDILECPKCGNESLVRSVLPGAPWALRGGEQLARHPLPVPIENQVRKSAADIDCQPRRHGSRLPRVKAIYLHGLFRTYHDARQVTLHDGLPFEVKIPNAETREALRQAREKENLKEYGSLDKLDC